RRLNRRRALSSVSSLPTRTSVKSPPPVAAAPCDEAIIHEGRPEQQRGAPRVGGVERSGGRPRDPSRSSGVVSGALVGDRAGRVHGRGPEIGRASCREGVV